MRYAGQSSGGCRADTVAGVNPPIDLTRCLESMEQPSNALYHAYFTRALCAHLRRIRRVRGLHGPAATPRSVGGVRGFDDRFTAPDAGYASAAEYYAGASAAAVISGVRRPALIVSAQDDPFVPVAMFEPHRNGASRVRFALPSAGGHCGYWSSDRPRFWAAEAVMRFLAGGSRDA
jgi:predicted alpha/beta-fold hydrolase